MISIPARAPARARPAETPRWRVAAGLAMIAGGAAMVAGAFLPWVETFAGLITIPGVRGSNGRILAGAGVVIAAAGLYHLVRGRGWPRWLAGLGGFAALGFSGYLLIQLAATMRALGGDSMVLARGGPGLWVTAAGALAAFATLFLPSAAPAAAAASGPRTAGAWRARMDRLRLAVLHRTADTGSSGMRRRLQVTLGLIWLADAALQFQPYMFGRGFVTGVLTPAAAGNPAAVAVPGLWAARLISHDVPAWNTAFALTQLAIALGLLWRPMVKAALAASIVWALSVWWLGEGLGGLLTGAATPLTGAPGAVILYALIAVLAWPPGTAVPGTAVPGRGGVAAASPLRGWATAAWVLLWASFAYLILQPAVRAPHALASALTGSAAGEPAWLAAVDHQAAVMAGAHGLAIAATLAVVFAFIAAGICFSATRRPALVLAAALALVVWVIGENFGMIFMGSATDPNSGPLLILLAAAFWPLRPGTTAGAPGREGARSGRTAVQASPRSGHGGIHR